MRSGGVYIRSMANEQEKRLADRLEEVDKEVRAWARVTRNDLRTRLMTLDLQERARIAGEPGLIKRLGYSLRRKDGELDNVAFSFPRHGIFLERGVGKHRPVGSVSAARAAKPWLSTILPDATEELAEILADEYANIAAAELRILIPGIIDTRIQGDPSKKLPDSIRNRTDEYNIMIDPSFF